MAEDEVALRIANVPLRVPLCRDIETTRALAGAIEERMREIEAVSTRIDTTAFALRAAYEFAMDLFLLRQEQEATVEEVALALDQVLQRVANIADKIDPQG